MIAASFFKSLLEINFTKVNRQLYPASFRCVIVHLKLRINTFQYQVVALQIQLLFRHSFG
jgi:general stress protein CsbA